MKIERAISNMLKENTGVHMLDSGGNYGRHFERNKNIDFNKINKIEVELNEYDGQLEVILTKNVYWYLIENLKITDLSEKLNKMFKGGCNKDTGYLTEMEDFIELVNQNTKMYSNQVYNTSNGEDFLSQTLQYGLFEVDKRTFIILQIHGGCDIRGGYTKPRVFELEDVYLTNSADFRTKDGLWTDDGYNWYDEDSKRVNINDIWYIKDDKLYNKRTNKEVVFI